MVWSTFLGGLGDELPHSLVVNGQNELLMYGSSGSSNFPCSNNAFDNTFNGGTAFTPQGVGTTYPNGCDIVLTQLNSDGSNLIMSTYYGGSGNDGVNTAGGLKFNYADEFRGEIDLDEMGNIYVVGTTQSSDFPLINSTAAAGGMQDVFVLKMNGIWQLQYAQKWGGSEDESGCSVAIKDGEVWLCGGTQSLNLPVSNSAYQSNFGGGSADGWVAHLSDNGQWLNASYWAKQFMDSTTPPSVIAISSPQLNITANSYQEVSGIFGIKLIESSKMRLGVGTSIKGIMATGSFNIQNSGATFRTMLS